MPVHCSCTHLFHVLHATVVCFDFVSIGYTVVDEFLWEMLGNVNDWGLFSNGSWFIFDNIRRVIGFYMYIYASGLW